MAKRKCAAEYSLYVGEEILVTGTVEEIAQELGITKEVVYCYQAPSVIKRGNRALVRLDLEEGEMNTKECSELQEKQIAKLVNGKTQSNSGGTKFGGGDVLTDEFLIEAKSTTKSRKMYSIRKEWLNKAQEQAFEQGKSYSTVAVRFDPEGEDYFIINSTLFKLLVEMLEKGEQ